MSAEPIRAQLYNSDEAIALGIVARAHAPVLALCRKLVAAGYDPATPLHAYRGAKLALRVRSIGEGARLRINRNGTGFVIEKEPERAPPGCAAAPLVSSTENSEWTLGPRPSASWTL